MNRNRKAAPDILRVSASPSSCLEKSIERVFPTTVCQDEGFNDIVTSD